MLGELITIFERLRNGISKKGVRISIEEIELVTPGDGIKFRFSWVESRMLNLTWILDVTDMQANNIPDEAVIDQVINIVNRHLEVYADEGSKENPK